MLRSLGLVLSLETFAKFLRVSVSDNLVSEKVSVSEKFGPGKKSRFRKIYSRKKVLISKKLVPEKSLGLSFGKFCIKKVLVSVSENLVSEKKSLYRFRSKFWYRHLVVERPLLGENMTLTTQFISQD